MEICGFFLKSQLKKYLDVSKGVIVLRKLTCWREILPGRTSDEQTLPWN